jgi:glycolate oxidase FAD binding subunit
MDAQVAQLADQVRRAADAREPLRIEGGGSKAFYGGAVTGTVLHTRDYHGVIEYEPSELVITVRSGTPLAQVEALLAAEGQMLAFEPPHLGASATIGGMLATGLAGPRRLAQGVATGGVRDSVLGVRLIDGRGDVLKFGGRVVKNVAGYDVSRVIAGSLGTLGVVLDVSFRVVPVPPCEITLQKMSTADAALSQMRAWRRLPWPISATAYGDGHLAVRLSGSALAVEAAAAQIGGERLSAVDAAKCWHDLRELRFAEGSSDTLWRIGLPLLAPALDLPGTEWIEWHGQRRWLLSACPAAQVRARSAELGGHVTRFKGGDAAEPVFPTPSAVVARWEQRLRAAFDPMGILNPGRLHANAAE